MTMTAQTINGAVTDNGNAGVSSAMPSDFIALLKPRVMSLVIFTALAGLLIAPGSINPFIGLVAILCISVGAGASGALNMWYDADVDLIMDRTTKRPIPTGRVSKQEALAFGLALSFASVLTMGVLVNWFSAAFLAFTIFFYAVVYTMWLKRSTPQNIVIGGAAGAFPPMIGWAAVTGSVSLESIVLFMIIFMWTPPHFWALAIFKEKDYGEAGIPMMPNVKGVKSTKNQIMVYAVLTALFAVAPWPMGFASAGYGIVAAILSALFVKHAYATWKMPEVDERKIPAKKLFGYSIAYLFFIFAALIVDHFAGLYLGAA